ncbi:MAG: hypothetical protein R3E50_07745 [Halioglobus sp.]
MALYARQLPLLVEDIELGLPVELGIAGDKSVVVTIADRSVILSHPRLNLQGAFEQEILADFCSRHSCEEVSTGLPENNPIPVSSAQVRPEWSFTTEGPVCTYEGITLRFKSGQNIATSRVICEQFLQEVVTLANELTWQQNNGALIDWRGMEIQATPHRPGHIVRINTAGDSVLVTIPLLYRSPALFERLLPWLQQRLDDQVPTTIELDAYQYGW